MNHYMLLGWDDFYPMGGIDDLISTIEAVDHEFARKISVLRIKEQWKRDEYQLLWINSETVDTEVVGHWRIEDKFSESSDTKLIDKRSSQ